MTFAEALTSAEAQYQQHRAAYVAALSPERLGQSSAMQRSQGELASASPSSGSGAAWFTGLSVHMLG